ncbi:hypothetical protein Q2K19_25915 [Micromonospora soli]|uniref:hypothetical protein n=1 Tax=Micromonospora sp. NBRC 110009 TaxID=3061627 RepID=UPI002672D913|nr:hypothetical protein [Micromonospora sp. NBRC 110009]WKT97584.1 hypothetical protein Q2K19_25915 [Micromonospora sp. NBRC 110009]
MQIRLSEDAPDQAIVGRPEVGEFIELAVAFADAIRILGSGASLAEAEHRIQAQHGVEVDLAELVEALEDVGFVAELDGRPIPDPHKPAVSHVPWLTAAHVRWLFGTPAKLAYAALVTATLVTVARRPDLLPLYRDFFWTDYVGLAVLVNTVMFSLAATAHELSHLAAARSLGSPGRIAFATRLHHLVLQTDVTAIWLVPRKYRYRVYLSGMLCDLAVICTAILLIAHVSLPPVADRLLAALIVVLVASMALQVQLYMRTDLYFVLLDLLRCRNLFHDGLAYTRHLLRRLGHAIAPARFAVTHDPAADLPAHERRAVRIYAAAVVVGSAISLGSFAVYGLPIIVYGVSTALSAIIDGVSGGKVLAAVDGTLIVLVEGALQAIFLVTFYRRYRHRLRWRRRPDRSASDAEE